MRAFTALWSGPIDILRRSLDIARLTVDATVVTYPNLSSVVVVLRKSQDGPGDSLGSVDVERQPQRLRVVVDVLVHPSGTESALEAVELGPLRGGMLVPVRDLQMHGLVLVVTRARSTDAGQDVEAEGAIGFGVFDRGTSIGPLRRRVIGSRMLQRPGSTTSEDEGFQAGVEYAPVEPQRGVE